MLWDGPVPFLGFLGILLLWWLDQRHISICQLAQLQQQRELDDDQSFDFVWYCAIVEQDSL